MNTITYKSGSLLSPVLPYSDKSTYAEVRGVLMKEFSASIDKINEYLTFKDQLDEEERQSPGARSKMSLPDVRKTIRNREIRITRFIESLTDNQITLLYLLFQAGSDLQAGMMEGRTDICGVLCRYVDADFNFSGTNNRQFKLSYFHDYLFTRSDAARNVRMALSCFS